MKKIVINGGKPLFGEISISGMKNAAMPIIYACLLVKGDCFIDNLPNIRDVRICLEIIESMGAEVERLGENSVRINCDNAVGGTAPSELVSKIRASYYLLGAELGRFGRTKVTLPGGCNFGTRPIDQHLKGFRALGAQMDDSSDEYVTGEAPEGLRPTNIFFDVVSVGATMNIMLAATCVEGTTIIDNAAREPHVVDLANFLNTCGADIRGAGTDTIKINGTKDLQGCSYTIIPDMIEAGTYLIAAAATKGMLKITNVIPKHLDSTVAKLEEMGVKIIEEGESVTADGRDITLKAVNIKTRPYPGFPTDMHPQFGVLLAIAEGEGQIFEGIYEKRFKYTDELIRMGAKINVELKKATFKGVSGLKGAAVRAADLRAGAAVVLAGLCADGTTQIDDVHLIERGYDDIVGKLQRVGADIEYVEIN
ncbi:MAG: UDP-N-acetylglucosamine 1-carboxyvinyltransferase [Clostridia bacterium]|nr:UDP-N-acetylglucosamine 1-carboxyvinyltransferase [Clostridia bacterium]